MKTKLTMLIALFLLATTGIYAQQTQGQTVSERVKERVKTVMDKLTPALTLDTSQQTKTEAVFSDYYNAQMKMFQDSRASGNRPDRSEWEKLSDERDTKLKAIFTDDQYNKFKSEVEETLRPQRRTQGS